MKSNESIHSLRAGVIGAGFIASMDAGGVRDLDGLIKVRDLGATRCGATVTAAMLDEYRHRDKAEQAGTAVEGRSPTLGAGGY